MYMEMSSGNRQPFYLGLNVLTLDDDDLMSIEPLGTWDYYRV